MTKTETKYCQTVEAIMKGDEDAKDDLWFDFMDVLKENQKKFQQCKTYKEVYNVIKEEKI